MDVVLGRWKGKGLGRTNANRSVDARLTAVFISKSNTPAGPEMNCAKTGQPLQI